MCDQIYVGGQSERGKKHVEEVKHAVDGDVCMLVLKSRRSLS